MKNSIQYLRQPKYFKDFSCMGGSCPVNCCLIWRVDWRKDEIEKLRNADCSPELKELAEKSFAPIEENDGMYAVVMKDVVHCPFLTEDNFCRIQRELGEEYLSYTCQMYPRHGHICGNYAYNFCNLSCSRVMDILCNRDDCMELENSKRLSGKKKLHYIRYSSLSLINHPELKYHGKILEFFYDIVSDRSHSFETSIVLGALAAKVLSKFIKSGRSADEIPKELESIKQQINDPEQISRLEEVSPNYKLKIGFTAQLYERIVRSDLLSNLGENGQIIIEKYIEGENRFNQAFKDRPFALRNIALNLLLELDIPFKNIDYDIYDNYAYFVSAIAVIKLIGAATFEKPDQREEAFRALTSYICRDYSHKDHNFNIVKEHYLNANITSPAYLALLIK